MPDRPPSSVRRHTSRLRVRYSECDPMGVVHHAAYAPWLEIGRTDLLRAAGVSYATLESRGVLLVVVSLEIRYRRPVLYDDTVEIRTRWSGGSRVKIIHDYDVVVVERDPAHSPTPPPEGIVAAVATTTIGCVDRDSKISPLPDWLVWRPEREEHFTG